MGGGALSQLGVRRTRFRVSTVLREAAIATLRHPGRSLLVAVGTVLGSAAFVATMGLSSTVGQQVSTAFDARRATEIIVRQQDDTTSASHPFDDESVRRLRKLNGVEFAGRRIQYGEVGLRRTRDATTPPIPIRILGADHAALRVIGPRLLAGRLFDAYHDDGDTGVIMLPGAVSERLGIGRLGTAVFIADRAFTVIGIYDDVLRRPEAMQAAIMPYTDAAALASALGEAVSYDVVVATMPGAAQIIGSQAPLVLRPEDPRSLVALVPPDPRTLRREIEDDLRRAGLILSIAALVLGTASVGNAAAAGIAARTSEIGLRRAVGARPLHILAQLAAETAAVGGTGGVIGAMLGMVITAAASLWNGWTPVIDFSAAAMAAAAGAGTGLLAGLFPAVRAMRIQPVSALQR